MIDALLCLLHEHKPYKTGCCKQKSFDPTFSKVGGFLGQRPESRLASLETPRTSEKVPLFGTFSPR